MPRRKVHRPDNDAFDQRVGRLIRQRRTMIGMSQEKLGDLLGLSFQQVQKYERGFNRLSASRLVEVSQLLKVPVSFFFGDGADAGADGADAKPALPDALQDRDALRLAQAFAGIQDADVRRLIFSLVQALGRNSSQADRA